MKQASGASPPFTTPKRTRPQAPVVRLLTPASDRYSRTSHIRRGGGSLLVSSDRPVDGRYSPTPSQAARDQRHDEQHEEDEKQHFGDPGCTGCDTAEAEKRRNQRDDEEH